MKKLSGKILSAAIAVTAFSLVACSAETPESGFDDPLPWGAYEKLEYDVAIYDTSKSAAEDKREKIAGGEMSYTLQEGIEGGYTKLDFEFSVKYDDDKDRLGKDAGCVDTISCSTLFEPKSLNTKSMTREVKLSTRKGVENLSYKIDADYFGSHRATLLYTDKLNRAPATLGLPGDPCHDNETMFFVARAQGVGDGSSTFFRMVNLFDSFLKNEVVQYGISVSGSGGGNIDLGDWVKDFGIEAVTDENTQAVSYPVPCISASMMINADDHGPAYYVKYARVPFKSGAVEHKKLPVRIEYAQYSGSNNYRQNVYTLKSCTLDSPAQSVGE